MHDKLNGKEGNTVSLASHTIIKYKLRHLIAAVILFAGTTVSVFLIPGVALAQTTCTDLGSSFGQANYSLTGVQAGNHSLWLRIKSADGTPSLKFNLSGGGTRCNQTVTTTGATAWKWVKSTNAFTTTGGNVAVQLAGNEAGVGVDCFVLTSDTSFAPTTAASDCTGPQVDSTSPAAAFTAPASGANISGTATVSASASDAESGIQSVLFRVNGRNDLDFTDTAAPYSNSLNTNTIANGTIQLIIIATNGDGLTTTVTRNVTVTNATSPPPDTTLPTASITAPANGSTQYRTSVSVSATATDNVGISNVKLYLDGNLYLTDTTSPYSFTINNTGLADGAHQIYAVATDSNNNTANSSTISFTYRRYRPGDVNDSGNVDLTDFNLIRTNFGLSGRTRAQGDLSGDGTVNLTDFNELRTNFGQ